MKTIWRTYRLKFRNFKFENKILLQKYQAELDKLISKISVSYFGNKLNIR